MTNATPSAGAPLSEICGISLGVVADDRAEAAPNDYLTARREAASPMPDVIGA